MVDNVLSFVDGTVLVNLFFLLITLINVIFLRLTAKHKEPTFYPMVSVLIPARNEAHRIRPCLVSLLCQDYPNYEVIVLNDNSTDETETILQEFMTHPHFRYINGQPLPREWKGKPYACQQLYEIAKGDLLLFTDADTVHAKNSLRFLVGQMQKWNTDFLSGFALHEAKSPGEKLILPAVYMMTILALPLPLVYFTSWPFFSFAIGQILLFKRKVLNKIGGFEKVRDHLVEDLAMSSIVKKHGFRAIFIDAMQVTRCRMYDNFAHGFLGIARVIYPAISKNPFLFLALVSGITSAILWPFVDTLKHFFTLSPSLLSAIIFLLTWGIFMRNRKQSWLSVFAYPVIFLNLLFAAFYSLGKTGFGKGILWKERLVK
ncbi:MAG: glycosyltransferase [Brevinematales bacterium]